jgi:hypothetical protein
VSLERVTADTPERLDEISGLVNDAYADPKFVVFDQARHEVRFPCAQEIDTWRELPEASLPRTKVWKRPGWPFVRMLIPFFQIDLTIRNARSMRLGPEDRLADPWSLNEFLYDRRARRLVLDPTVGPDLAIEVEGIDVEGAITDHVALMVERRTGLFGESDVPHGDLQLR